MLKRYFRLIVLFTLSISFSRHIQAQPQESYYQIGAGDVLQIDVWAGERREEDLSGQYLVFSDGYIEMPLLGKIVVQQKSLQEVSQTLNTELSSNYIRNPHISIKIEEYASQVIHVLGSVEKPGSFTMTRNLSLAEVLAKAEGTNRQEKGAKQVKITRDTGEKIVIDLEKLLVDGTGNIQLEAGDVVYVTEGLFVIVNGKVEEPGTIPWRTGMTITEAIAEAGGSMREANLREVFLLRNEKRIPVNVKLILQGKEVDIPLEHGDKVFLEESPW